MTNPLADDLQHVLSRTRGVWDELNGGNLFVTGGTGFFGLWLLESFVWACDNLAINVKATVLTRSPEAFALKAPHLAGHTSIRLLKGDVTSFPFPVGNFTHIIHAATEATPEKAKHEPLKMLDSIVVGTRRCLDFARLAGTRRFLLTSSGAVYGQQPPELRYVPESHPGSPDTLSSGSAYAEGKRMAELLCGICHRDSGVECTVARCFAFVGPYLPLDKHFAIGNFIRDHLMARPITVSGDGTPVRSYLYASDLAIWLWTILVQGRSCFPYNVGSSRDLSIADLAGVVAETLGASAPPHIAGKPSPGSAPGRYVPSTIRARSELGLEETVTLEDSIRKTAQWFLATSNSAKTA